MSQKETKCNKICLFYFPHRTSTKKRLIAFCVAILILAGIVSSYCLIINKHNAGQDRIHGHGAVSANGKECADIGVDILRRGGSVADAAISVLLCEGVTCENFNIYLKKYFNF